MKAHTGPAASLEQSSSATWIASSQFDVGEIGTIQSRGRPCHWRDSVCSPKHRAGRAVRASLPVTIGILLTWIPSTAQSCSSPPWRPALLTPSPGAAASFRFPTLLFRKNSACQRQRYEYRGPVAGTGCQHRRISSTTAHAFAEDHDAVALNRCAGRHFRRLDTAENATDYIPAAGALADADRDPHLHDERSGYTLGEAPYCPWGAS